MPASKYLPIVLLSDTEYILGECTQNFRGISGRPAIYSTGLLTLPALRFCRK